ncbi:LamG domain-containing protein [Asanoa sp. WMMD1127]|uniref:LamG domain-containing protein n=1 Tax=Asanoa sp. WMMD1127 TaxID=3016107 RepID=UPI0024169658|nr:LamG domain-containing protein [Asanoa sp. WMMD1127]MDG4820802.1 LamG domain-containing protein [Asanoa sp. WMMD1127]
MTVRRFLSVVGALSMLAGASSIALPRAAVAAVDPRPATAAAGPAAAAMELTETAATARARATGARVEVASMRGESQEVYALPSGRFEMVQHSRPVRARTDGRWAAVDPTLVRRDGGLVPKASTAGLWFSAGGAGPFARMSRAGRTMALSWPTPLPAPTVDGDTASYAGVLPGVDLRLRAHADGFSHVLVVASSSAARQPALARLRIAVDAPSLALEQEASGALRISDARSRAPIFEAPPPLMWDTPPAAAEAVDMPAAGATLSRVGVDARAGQITLVPDTALLTAGGTRFPLHIDPVWKTVGESANLMVSSGYPTTTRYNFTGTEGVGLCDVQFDGACVKDQKKRLFYRLPIGAFAGKHIISAEFIAYETHAYDCSDPSVVQLWHTGGFSTSSNWNTTGDNWLTHLASRDVAYCARTPVEFGGNGLRDVLRAAVGRGATEITFGLRAYSESTMGWWKRFAADTNLRVEYNTPPPQPVMKNLSMSPGGACVDWTKTPTVNRLPTLYAVLHDADSGSAAKLYAQFSVTWNGGKWTSAQIGPKTTGSTFQVTAPSSIIGKNELRWEVRTWDGYQWSPWSYTGGATSCWFAYDAAAPSSPSVTSTAYPPSNPDNPDDPWIDGVGRYGAFTFSTPSADVTRYRVNMNDSPAAEHRPATAGGSVTVPLAPSRAGVNFLYVAALDAAGNSSAPTTYLFRARSGSAPRAHWRLDEPAGVATVTADVRPGTAPVTSRINPGAILGIDGQVGTALRGNGSSGYAETAGPVIDTSQSFAVSAWAKLANTNGFATIVSQDGTAVSAFYLHYVKADNRWGFSLWNADAPGSSVRTLSTAAPTVGVWTHLVGVHDAVTDQSRLYVDGVLQQEKTFSSAWTSTGALAIGRARYNSAKNEFFPGDIDDVRVFDRILTSEEVADLRRQHPVLVSRWKLNVDGADDSGNGRPLSLGGDARVDADAGWLGSPPGGVVLDGSGDFAATAGPVVATGHSFTVAGWATAATAPIGKAAVFSQEGVTNSGFIVRYAPSVAGGVGGWQAEMPSMDSAEAVAQTVDHSAYRWQSQWDHLAVVYDALADTLRLYVNGTLEETTDRVSTRWNTVGFDATKALQLGRAKTGGAWHEFWPGVIDDVWAFSGVLSPEQVQTLAGFTEIPSDSPF